MESGEAGLLTRNRRSPGARNLAANEVEVCRSPVGDDDASLSRIGRDGACAAAGGRYFVNGTSR
jgi:hypothetical protein